MFVLVGCVGWSTGGIEYSTADDPHPPTGCPSLARKTFVCSTPEFLVQRSVIWRRTAHNRILNRVVRLVPVASQERKKLPRSSNVSEWGNLKISKVERDARTERPQSIHTTKGRSRRITTSGILRYEKGFVIFANDTGAMERHRSGKTACAFSAKRGGVENMRRGRGY